MRLHEVSQLPVMEDDEITGIVDETDILLAVYGHEDQFRALVSRHMTSKLEVIAPSASLDSLMPIFRADRVAIVVEDGEFIGLITRIDLINHLRRTLQ